MTLIRALYEPWRVIIAEDVLEFFTTLSFGNSCSYLVFFSNESILSLFRSTSVYACQWKINYELFVALILR